MVAPLAIAAVATQAVGSLFSAYAQYRAGKTARDRARENAALLRVQAEEELVKGEQGAQEIGKQVNSVIGEQRSAYAGQGVRVDTGSAAIVAEQSMAAAGMDIEKIRLSACKQAESNIRQAGMMERDGEEAYKAARFNAIGTIVSGGGSAASSYSSATSGNTDAAKETK